MTFPTANKNISPGPPSLKTEPKFGGNVMGHNIADCHDAARGPTARKKQKRAVGATFFPTEGRSYDNALLLNHALLHQDWSITKGENWAKHYQPKEKTGEND